jgi:hypothetical protein
MRRAWGIALLAAWASLATAGPKGTPAAPVVSGAEGPRVAFHHALVLKVADRDATADAVIAVAEKSGGYFLSRTNDAVRLKIPVAAVKEALAAIEPLGTVAQRSTQAADVGEKLDMVRTRLASREGMLKHYFTVVATASDTQMPEVEAAMTTLVQEIESLRGTVELVEHQLRYAAVDVNFSFRDRRAPAASGRSSFEWLNTVNLSDLIAEFGHE